MIGRIAKSIFRIALLISALSTVSRTCFSTSEPDTSGSPLWIKDIVPVDSTVASGAIVSERVGPTSGQTSHLLRGIEGWYRGCNPKWFGHKFVWPSFALNSISESGMEGRWYLGIWEGYPSLGCHWTMYMRWKLLVVGGHGGP